MLSKSVAAFEHTSVGDHIFRNIWAARVGLDISKKPRIPYLVDEGWQIWEELWEGGEYDQNPLYVILKKLIKC